MADKEKKNVRFQMLFTEAERARAEERAAEEGRTLSNYIIYLINQDYELHNK